MEQIVADYLGVELPPEQLTAIVDSDSAKTLYYFDKYDIENPFKWSVLQKAKQMINYSVRDTLHLNQPEALRLSNAIKSIKSQAGKRILITYLSRKELISLLFASDLFVFASHIEYSPLVLFESAASGLPFITIPVGNSIEIAHWTGGGEMIPAEEDKRGYVCAKPSILAEKMTQLALNKKYLKMLGEQSRRNWRKRFTWENICDEYEKILNNN